MFVMFLLGWWYGSGWVWALKRISASLDNLGKVFAVKILLKTLFAPWKQITSTGGFQGFFQRAADNFVSRMIGFFIRVFLLIFVAIIAFFEVLLGLIFLIFWPFIPLSIVILPYLALAGVGIK